MTMKINPSLLIRAFTLVVAVLPLANCASPSSYAPAAPASSSLAEYGGYAGRPAVRTGSMAPMAPMAGPLETAKKKASRHGLATQAGDERESAVADIPFFRKTMGQPDVVDSFHYNDEAGARAMVDALGGGTKKRGAFSVAGGRLEVALRESYTGPYERYEAGAKRIVVGRPGSSYEIFLSNQTKHAVEVVASVDSLDVMDGKAASLIKRGYIIPAKTALTIEGFRTNARTVRRFVFGSVDASAAAKAGRARNVGVIGLAVYDEDEAQARIARLMESQKRTAAQPFGG